MRFLFAKRKSHERSEPEGWSRNLPPNSQQPTANSQQPTASESDGAAFESPLLVALQRAGAGDLAAINERIDECERELETLKLAQRIIDRRLNGKSKSGGGAKINRDEIADKMFRVIQANGPGKPGDIGNKLGIGPVIVGKVAAGRPDLFKRTDEGKITLK